MYITKMPKKEWIQNIILSEVGVQSGTEELYYRGGTKISVSVDGA